MIPFPTTTPRLLLATTVASALLLGHNTAYGANPYSTNVIALTPKNWKEEVVNSPHAVFVNVCRSG